MTEANYNIVRQGNKGQQRVTNANYKDARQASPGQQRKTNNYRIRLDLHAKLVAEAETKDTKPVHLLCYILETYFQNQK